MLIIVPAVYLALQQQPATRSIALLSLGRKRGYTLAKAMEGDRDIRRRNAAKGAHRVIRVLRLKRISRPHSLAAQPSRSGEVSVHYAGASNFAIGGDGLNESGDHRLGHSLGVLIGRIGEECIR
jgi:hypothetical protein